MRIDGVEISDEQVDEFKEAFAEFDMNSDGTITSQELGLKQRTKEGLLYVWVFLISFLWPWYKCFYLTSLPKSKFNLYHFSCWRHGNQKSGRRNSNWRRAETNGSRSRSGGIQRI